MNNLSMQAKLFILIGSVIFVFLIAMSLIRFKTNAITEGFNRFYDENYSVSLTIEHLTEKQVDIVLNVRGLQIAYLLSLEKQIPGYLTTISSSYEATPQLLERLKNYFVGEENEIKQLESLVKDFQAKTKTFTKAMEEAPDNKAPFPIFSAFITSYDNLISYISNLKEDANKQALKAKQQGESLIEEANFYFWVCIIVALILASCLSYIVSRNIVLRIKALRDASQAVSEGYLNSSVSDISGSDELTELAGSINVTTENLRNVITNVLANVDAINENSNNVLEANARVGEVSSQVTEHTKEVLDALEDMSQMNTRISASSQHSVVAANDISGVASDNLNTANTTLKAINDLIASLQDTSSVIIKLKDETTNIETILNVIRSISEQTNLLALNAAIEAARAGEQGRGFAVVADEVRSLAQRSQESVNEIETMLEKLNEASVQAVQRMDLSMSQVDKSRDQVERTNELTSSIMEKVKNITDQSHSIADSATAQIDLSHKITTKMKTVQELTTRSAEFARDTGNEMASSSLDVKKQLGFFKV